MALADSSCVLIPTPTHNLIGIAYLAATDEPAPFALLLHGIPGSEKNHDLAYELRRQGWHVFILHFSGAWGSGGVYDPLNQPTDAHAALDFFLSDQAPRPIDPDRIAVVGNSLGSRAALLAAANDPRLKAVVTIGGICDYSEVLLADEFFGQAAQFLASTPADLKQNWNNMGIGSQPMEVITQIAPRPVLVLHGTADEIVPYYHADAFAAAGEHVHLVKIDGATHGFDSHRPQLIQVVTEFFETVIPARQQL